MSISTSGSAKSTTEVTKAKIDALREKHQDSFEALGIPGALFFPKMAYRPRGKDELYVSFFATELRREADIYTEFVSREYEPEDANRTLWLWRYNPHWSEEYETTEPSDLGYVRYLIPVSELVKVKVPEKKAAPVDPFVAFGKDLTDEPFTHMTIRDFAAIVTGKPVSNKEWLNKLIQR